MLAIRRRRSGRQPLTTPPIASPCIRVCSVNPKTSWCDGCMRTLKEIATWSRMSDAERDAVTADLERRRGVAAARLSPA